MREVILVDFDEIFNYAKKKFKVEWNDCCGIFHHSEALTYKSIDEISLEDIPKNMFSDSYGETHYDISIDDLLKMSLEEVEDKLLDMDIFGSNADTSKAYYIIAHFMKEYGLSEMVVDNT